MNSSAAAFSARRAAIVSAAPTSLIESSDVYRATKQAKEKKAIARAGDALRGAGPGGYSSMTPPRCTRWTNFLPAKVPLTVITNSLVLINELKDVNDVNLICLGGQFYNWCNAFMGHITTNEIRRLRADTVFMSLSAIVGDAVYHQSPETVETKRAMFESSAKRVLLADHTKFERRALHHFATLQEFDAVVVDEDIPISHLSRMRSAGHQRHRGGCRARCLRPLSSLRSMLHPRGLIARGEKNP
jgi:DeoR/GlpR family transcriptional regulator of sugar metabolism